MNKKLLILASILTILFIVSIALYSVTLPNINTGLADSDELITVAYIKGVAHPPGYPLYTVLAIIFGLVPLPLTFAGKINFMSAFFHAATVSCIALSSFLIAQKLFKSFRIALIGAISAGLFLATSFSFWFHGLFAEVFALHHFLSAVVITLVVYWWVRQEDASSDWGDKMLFIISFLSGLALSNQQTFIILLFFLALFILIVEPKILLRFRLIGIAIGLFLFGFLLPYIYLPIASRNQAAINWEDPQGISGVIRSILRKTYSESSGAAYLGGFKFGIEARLTGIANYSRFLSDNILFLIVPLILGLFISFKENKKLFVFLIFGIIGGGLFFASYVPITPPQDEAYYQVTRGIHERFYVVSLIFFSLAASIGVCYLALILSKKQKLLAPVILIFVFLVSTFIAYTNYQELRSINYSFANEYGRALLKSLPPNAILFCFGEHSCFSANYVQIVDGVRRDVAIIPADFAQRRLDEIKRTEKDIIIKTDTSRDTSRHSILLVRDIIRWNIDRLPIYVASIPPHPKSLSAYGVNGDPFYLVPEGCSYRVSRVFDAEKRADNCNRVEKRAIGANINRAVLTRMFPSFFALNHFSYGYTYASHGCFDLAKNESEYSIKLESSFHSPKNVLEQIKGKKDICEVKKANYEELVKQFSKESDQKALEKALYYGVQVVTLEPENVPHRLKLAGLYFEAGALLNARIEYQDVLVIDKNNTEAKIRLAQIDKLFEGQ